MDHLALGIFCEVFGMFVDPRILYSHMVGHPVKPHLHAVLVGSSHEGL